MASMPKKKRDRAIAECQKDLDRFLIDGYGESLTVEKPPLRFRYASGGTLPILNVNGDRYYCLIYREVEPIGWNIANGGCDTCDELLHPEKAMKRELSEELIIFDSTADTRLVFGETIDRPEFLLVRDLIEVHHPHLKIREREEKTLEPEWQTGPDELVVQIGRQAPVKTSGCYVNINAIDLGIEIDRAMEIELDNLPQIIDGELSESESGRACLVNAPIGLFKIDTLQDRLKEKPGEPRNFRPDIVYWGGTKHGGEETRHVVETLYIPTMERKLGKAQVDTIGATKYRYDLCPVTRNIIRRTAGC